MGHTPGPWRASEGWPSDIWHVDMPGRKWSVAVARHDEDDEMTVEEVIANARLIAAAPELLAALQEAVTALNVKEKFPVYDTDSYAIAARCDKAIAKAEGRSE